MENNWQGMTRKTGMVCQNRLKNNEIQIKKAVPRRIRKTALNLNRRMRDTFHLSITVDKSMR